MVKPYYERESLSRDDLLQDQEFLNDSYEFLQARTNRSIVDPEERIDELMELMRVSQVNEVSAFQNLTHVRDVDDRGKALMGKMFLAYDKTDGATGFWDKVLDYGEGLVTSPTTIASTLLAVPTLGGSLAARGGAQAGVQATNLAVRNMVKAGVGKYVKQQALKSGLKAASLEGALGAFTMGTEAAARRETGREEFEDIDVLEETVLGGVFGAAAGGILGGGLGALNAKLRGFKGLQKLDKYFTIKENRVKAGTVKRKEYIKANPEDEKIIEEMIEKLRPLDPEVTGVGRKIKRTIIPIFSRAEGKPRFAREGLVKEGDRVIDEAFVAGLPPEVMRNASAAALDMMRKSLEAKNFTKAQIKEKMKTIRITEVLHEALKKTVDGDYDPTKMKSIITAEGEKVFLTPWDELHRTMKDYGLSPKEFSQVYMAEVSDAARILQQQSAIKKQTEKMLRPDPVKQIKEFKTYAEQIQYLKEHQRSVISDSRITRELEIPQAYLDNMKIFQRMVEKGSPKNFLKAGWRVTKNMDKARLGLMTIQPATTIRNTLNGTARLPLFALDNLFHGAITGDMQRILAGPRLLSTMLDPTESQMLKIIFSEEMPDTATQLYRKAADIEAATLPDGKPSRMIQVSRWLNGANTLADNAFKRAIFFTELSTRVGKKELMDKMLDAKFTEIPDIDKHVSEAMQEALSFTYQKGFKSKGAGAGFWEAFGNGFIKTFNRPGASLLVPFPRYTANSIEFMYKHAPLIGLSDLPYMATKGKFFGGGARKNPNLLPLSREGKDTAGNVVVSQKIEKAGKLVENPKFEEQLIKQNKLREISLKNATEQENLFRQALPKRIANQLTGTAMLYGAIQLRAAQGPNAKWYEMYNEDTREYMPSMAFYGPFALYMLVADIILKSNDFGDSDINLVNPKQWEDTAKSYMAERLLEKDTFGDFLKAVAGPQFKTGMGSDFIRGLYDGVTDYNVATEALDPTDPNYESEIEKAESKIENMAAETLGNIAATFLVPLGAVRDVMAGFDPEDYQGMKSTDSISPADTFIKKALRALPIDREGRYVGLFSAKEGARFVLFSGEGSPAQEPITATKRPDAPPAQREKGVRRQFTGLGSPYEKNVLEEELERQGLKAYKLFPRIPQSSELTRSIRKYYQERVAGEIIPYINSSKYKDIPQREKGVRLEAFIRESVESPLSTVQERLLYKLQDLEKGTDEYEKTEENLSEALQIEFKKGKDIFQINSIELFRNQNDDRNPNFNDIRDMLELLMNLKVIKKGKD